ncbi:hypothetical protein CerSpe_196360 [Prunus speciosa]
MATVSPPVDQAADLLQNLSLDSQTKGPDDIPDPAKKPNIVTAKSKSYVRSKTPLRQDFMDPAICYIPNGYTSSACYYGAYGGTGNEWGGISSYVNPNGSDMNSAVYGDNGSFLYHHGYGYAPYSTYSTSGSSVPTVGGDGQLYGPQQYQYPPYFKKLTPNSKTHTPNSAVPFKGSVSTSKDADHKPSTVGIAKGISNGVLTSVGMKEYNPSDFAKPTYQNSSLNVKGSFSEYHDAIYGFDGLVSPIPWLEGANGQGRAVTGNTVNRTPYSKNQISRSNSEFMGLHHMRLGYGMDTANGLVNGMYANGLYGHYWNPNRLGMGYGSNGFGMQRNGGGWMAFQNKYKSRGRGSSFRYGNQDIEGLDELNKGPRGKSYKNHKGYSTVTVAVKGCNMLLNKTDDEKDALSVIPECEQYIGADIHDHYADAKFFIIKSYSEDDVHKSVKYNVWASTPNGNNKLNAAYQEAQEKSGGCPVFLFFSVNTSGQFVGLAEMVGMVDFDKSVEYWQQDKWTGCFPVKWHIVKDVPNSLLKHITLENNENKPVTNSRDTQEVKSEQGLKMIKIFKDHSSKTCLLDDFDFYEARQKTIQENKAKQQIRKQVLDGKPTNGRNYRTDESLKTPESFGTALDLIKEPTSIAQTDEELKLSENGSVAETGDGPKGPEAVVSEVTVTE